MALNLAPSLPHVQVHRARPGADAGTPAGRLRGSFRAEGGTITLQTEASPDRVRLHLTDTGPQVSAEDLRAFFNRSPSCGAAAMALPSRVCKAIVRRFQGTIHAENHVEGGMAIAVELRPAPNHETPRAAD